MAKRSEQILLEGVQLSFPTLFEPRAVNEGERLRYSATIVIEEGSEAAKKVLKAFTTTAKDLLDELEPDATDIALVDDAEILGDEGYRVKAKNGRKNLIIKSTLRNDQLNNLDKYPFYEGKLTFTAATGEDFPPTVVDRKTAPISEEDRRLFHSGVEANVFVRPYFYSRGQYGVTFALNAVQYVGPGEKWSSGSDASAGFKVLDQGTEATGGFSSIDDLI